MLHVSRTELTPCFSSPVNEQLQMTGLSDMADILTDLMDGGVSASELGLTETQARAIHR